MSNHLRLKLLVAAVGMATATATTAANTQTLRAQNLGAVPVSSLAMHLNLGQDMTLAPQSSSALANGQHVVRQQQMYRGVPVYGRSIGVVQDGTGNALRATGELLQASALSLPSVSPRLSPAAAINALRSHVHTTLIAGTTLTNSKSDLFVYPQDNGPTLLVYRVSYFVNGAQPSRPTAIIDANSGAVIQSWEGLTHASANGPGGNQKTGEYNYGTDYAALNVTQSGSTCYLQNTDVKTYNLHGASSGGSVVSFTCPTSNTDAINGAYSPVNDAHHFGGVVHDMYQSYTGAAPLTIQLLMKVHYQSNYENAFWDGSAMYFGDGASTFYPLVSLDVTSHEISHGYTEQNSGLQYTGMAGGMNEAYSDIAGEAAEYFDRGTADFLVGADIMKSTGSIDNAANYTSSMDVHYTSGVYNKSFCLLAKTSGWDVKKAFQVYALANKTYWTATSTFNAGACGVESAAVDYGYSVANVISAFNAVGVTCPNPPGGGNPPPPTGGSLQNGVAATGLSAPTNGDINYTVVIPSGASNLVIATSGGSGDLDLYTKFGSAPTSTSYDCRPYKTGNSESCSVAAPNAGTYYVRLHAYSAFSSASVKATWTTGGTTPPPSDQSVLSNGVPVTGIYGSSGSKTYFTVTVPAGSALTIATSGGTGDMDLYVKQGSQPTTSSYDCRPYKTGNNETCSGTNESGTYYIMLNGYKAYSGVTLKATW